MKTMNDMKSLVCDFESFMVSWWRNTFSLKPMTVIDPWRFSRRMKSKVKIRHGNQLRSCPVEG